MRSITINHVTKTYGAVTALKDVSLTFEENKIYGLLGRNGAGKSTLLKIIAGWIRSTAGTVTLDGRAVWEQDDLLEQIHYMGDWNTCPEEMTVQKMLYWGSKFYPNFDYDYAIELCQKFQLPLKKKVAKLSTGYQSICKFIFALATNVPFLFLDEPVLGLDANHRQLFYRELIANYAQHPKTVVISTHLIEEAADLLEEVVILKEGRVLLTEDAQTLCSRGYTITGPVKAVEEYAQGMQILGSDTLGGMKSVYIMGDGQQEPLPHGLERTKLDLQQLFIHLTNS